jgi:four helix bundle protein
MGDFHDLTVWHRAHELTLEVYRLTQVFPREELYGLTSQMRRASASIPTNIAEGCGRKRDTELVRFLAIASGSANELEYQLLLARDLQYLSPREYDRSVAATNEIKRMLTMLSSRLTTRPSTKD